MTLYAKKGKSAKTGREYLGLFIDLGYKQKALTFDTMTIAEVTNKTVRELDEMPVDTRVVILEERRTE